MWDMNLGSGSHVTRESGMRTMIGRGRRLAGAIGIGVSLALVVSACGGGGSSASGGTPPADQKIVVGGYNYKTLDSGAASGYIGKSAQIGYDIFGTLFDPPEKPGGDPVPDLATDFTYNDDFTSLTVNLRKGVTFQDGTPFDADAVAFNVLRYRDNPSPASQYVRSVADAKAVSPTQVDFTFKTPTANFIQLMTFGYGAFIGSPTAIKADPTGYGLKPVGAGPFKVESNKPGEELVLTKYDKYWDAKNVTLTEVRYITTSEDAQVAYQHVQSGSVDSVQVSGSSTPPNTLTEAKGNPNITLASGPDNSYTFLPINTFKAPFDKLEARQAIDYCTDRESIAKNVQGGFANPAYVVVGSDSDYYPKGGIAGAKKAFPYKYDVKKGKQLVQQLGGLSFSVINIGGQAQVVAQALAQQWTECGMQVQVQTVDGPVLAEDYANGNYQMAYAPNGGLNDPAFNRTFQVPNTPQGSFGFAKNHPEIPALIQKAAGTNDPDELESIWTDFFNQVNKLAVTIPVISAPNYYFQNKCLSGVSLDVFGSTFRKAKLTC
jgi:peptide/nickel transport system substrate-binding protein